MLREIFIFLIDMKGFESLACPHTPSYQWSLEDREFPTISHSEPYNESWAVTTGTG